MRANIYKYKGYSLDLAYDLKSNSVAFSLIIGLSEKATAHSDTDTCFSDADSSEHQNKHYIWLVSSAWSIWSMLIMSKVTGI